MEVLFLLNVSALTMRIKPDDICLAREISFGTVKHSSNNQIKFFRSFRVKYTVQCKTVK